MYHFSRDVKNLGDSLLPPFSSSVPASPYPALTFVSSENCIVASGIGQMCDGGKPRRLALLKIEWE